MVFILVLAFSAGFMVWMTWHFPLGTALVALAVLSGFAVSARLARSVDTESLADLEHGNQSA